MAKKKLGCVRMDFQSYTVTPLCDGDGKIDWNLINNLPAIILDEAIYLLAEFGIGGTNMERYKRLDRVVEAFQFTGEFLDTSNHISWNEFFRLAQQAGIELPTQLQLVSISGAPSIDIQRYEEVLAAAIIMKGCAEITTPRRRSDVINFMRRQENNHDAFPACFGLHAPYDDTALGNSIRRGGKLLKMPKGQTCPLKNPKYLSTPDIPRTQWKV